MAIAVAAIKTAEDLLVATFQLGGGRFAIDTNHIQEVVMTGDLTPVRHAPAYVAGIRNLRGRIITVIDLQVRPGKPHSHRRLDGRAGRGLGRSRGRHHYHEPRRATARAFQPALGPGAELAWGLSQRRATGGIARSRSRARPCGPYGAPVRVGRMTNELKGSGSR